MMWLVESGFLDVRREETIRLAERIPARGLLGAEHTISHQALSARGIVLLGRFAAVEKAAVSRSPMISKPMFVCG